MDIVNEDDEVIGQDTRAAIHSRGDIHRGVHVFVVNRNGRLLLQQRASSTNYYPGYWDASAGGQVAAGETYEQAAIRELDEELGCQPGPLDLVAKYNSYSSRQREKRMLFIHRCEGPFRLSKQVQEVRFVRPEEIARMVENEAFTEGFQRSFALWMASRNGRI
jgi:16S rRNA (adenine1518-N6/adenine1519-N6)-dimethyltransferase